MNEPRRVKIKSIHYESQLLRRWGLEQLPDDFPPPIFKASGVKIYNGTDVEDWILDQLKLNELPVSLVERFP